MVRTPHEGCGWRDPMADSVIRSVTIHRLAIPMRRRVTHAASQRAVAEPIVVAVELQNGTLGHGETLPRPYVTGETGSSNFPSQLTYSKRGPAPANMYRKVSNIGYSIPNAQFGPAGRLCYTCAHV